MHVRVAESFLTFIYALHAKYRFVCLEPNDVIHCKRTLILSTIKKWQSNTHSSFTCMQTQNLQGKVWNNWVCLFQTWHTAVINTGSKFIFRDFEKVFYSPGCMIGGDQIKGIWIFFLSFLNLSCIKLCEAAARCIKLVIEIEPCMQS